MMNKIIEEMAKQAGSTTFGGEQCIFGDEDMEKFARLVIDECVNICLGQRDPQNLNYKPSVIFADAIRLHFSTYKGK